MADWAVASIAIGLVILLYVRRIAGWMGAADDEPLVRESRKLLPGWLTLERQRRFRIAWVGVIGLVFVAMGVAALL
jgi:hypothetical protein